MPCTRSPEGVCHRECVGWRLGANDGCDRLRGVATSSGASADFSAGVTRVTRDEAMSQIRVICEATDLPVSADLEKGFGNSPDIVAETIGLAPAAGLVGGSIEDPSGNPNAPISIAHAVERVAAAASSARALPFPFALTGRTENFLRGRPDLDDTIRRLKAYEAAGADAPMAPGLPDLDRCARLPPSASRSIYGRDQGQVVHRRRSRVRRGQAHQPRHLALRAAMTGC